MFNQITISYGDTDEAAELMEAALTILAEAGAVMEIETVQLGHEMVRLGFEQGFDDDVLRKIRCSGNLLKTHDSTTGALCAALEIDDARETYGQPYTAQSFSNEGFTIFEPAENNAPSVLNAAIMALRHLKQDDIATRIENALKKSQAGEQEPPQVFAEKVMAKLFY